MRYRPVRSHSLSVAYFPFNRIDHSLVIQDLYDMHTPPWLLRILSSYLSGRSMTLSYRGAKSSSQSLPGSGPQGAYLGGILFIIKYNAAFLRPPVPRNLQGPVTKAKSEKVKGAVRYFLNPVI